MPLRELEKRLPVRRGDSVSAGVVMKPNCACDDWFVQRWPFSLAEVLLAKQTIHGTGCNFGEKFPARIGPLILGSASDEDRVWSIECNDHVRVHGHVVPVAGVFLEIARELPWEVCSHVINGFAVIPAGQRRAHLAGATGEDESEARVVGAGPESG